MKILEQFSCLLNIRVSKQFNFSFCQTPNLVLGLGFDFTFPYNNNNNKNNKNKNKNPHLNFLEGAETDNLDKTLSKLNKAEAYGPNFRHSINILMVYFVRGCSCCSCCCCCYWGTTKSTPRHKSWSMSGV